MYHLLRYTITLKPDQDCLLSGRSWTRLDQREALFSRNITRDMDVLYRWLSPSPKVAQGSQRSYLIRGRSSTLSMSLCHPGPNILSDVRDRSRNCQAWRLANYTLKKLKKEEIRISFLSFFPLLSAPLTLTKKGDWISISCLFDYALFCIRHTHLTCFLLASRAH